MLTVKFEKNKIFIPQIINQKSKFNAADKIQYSLDKESFKRYPYQNFDYNYNSWGFRGEDYEQYLGKPIIACIGDSFTVNIGGPITHSWPSLLQKNFDIPCLNFGVNGAGNDIIRLIYDKVCELFDIKFAFVLYSFFHRRFENGELKSEPHDHLENIKHFENNFINNVFYQFIPPYCFTDEELNYINNNYKNKPEDYFDSNEYWIDGIDRKYVSKNDYNNMRGSDWSSYEEFLSGASLHKDIITGKYKLPLNNTYCLNYRRNRDGLHLDLKYNQRLADNLYQQHINLTKGDVK